MFRFDQAGLAVSTLRVFSLPPPCRIWAEEGAYLSYPESVRTSGQSWRIVPDGSPYLIVQLIEGQEARVRLVGARSVYADADVRRRPGTIGIRLRPGVLPTLIRGRVDSLTDTGACASDVFGRRGIELVERVQARSTAREVLKELVRFLARQLDGEAPGSWKLRGFLWHGSHGKSSPSIASIARRLGVSVRTLREAVRNETGLSPKRLLRIRRAHGALALALAQSPSSWAHLGATAGYFDQAHLIRDFQGLFGETPVRFLARAGRVVASD